MKLLIINPIFEGEVLTPTLSLGYLATYVRDRSDCRVEIVEPILQQLSREDVLEKARDADIVALTCYTDFRFQCFDFAKKIRETNPFCKIVVGGPHATPMAEGIINHYPFVDGVVRLEGEETLLDIVNKKEWVEIEGITWRKEGKAITNPDRPLIKNIDGLYYDYSMTMDYIRNWKDREVSAELQSLNHLPVIASRGCPFLCTYCSANKLGGKVWRSLSPEELVNRMEVWVKEYNIGYLRFYDALFTGNKERTLRICDLIESKKLKVDFRIDVRVGTDKEVLKRLRKAGCSVVGFGVESGSDRMLKKMRKGITREQIERTIADCRDLDFWMLGFFMTSLPGETEEDSQRTAELFKYFDVFNLQFFKIYPNTADYYELVGKKEINDNIWFDENHPRDLFFCKENFPSAGSYSKDVDLNILYYHHRNNIFNPSRVLKRYGVLRGSFVVSGSLLITLTLGNSIGKNIFGKMKDTALLKEAERFYKRVKSGSPKTN